MSTIHIKKSIDSIYLGEEPIPDTKYYGKIYNTDGTSYQGYFMNGLKHGFGHSQENNNYNEGYYREGKLNGEAISYVKGTGYVRGFYQDGNLNGESISYDEKCTLVNKGMYKDGKSCLPTYETIYNTVNGVKQKVYEGFIFNDQYNGFGKLYENGRVYIGNMTTGKKDGKFLVCYLDGSLVYSPQTNLEIIIDIDKVNRENFNNYKNTILYTNDVFDDDHKIVYKQHNIIKYIGKFNTNMEFHDDSGCYYDLSGHTFIGNFENGKFTNGSYNFGNGRYKGEFKNFVPNGNGVIEFKSGNKFESIFNNGISEISDYKFKYNGYDALIKCSIILRNGLIQFETNSKTYFKLDDQNTYIGEIKINLIGQLENQNVKIAFKNGKHYVNNILIYEGEFINFAYNGSGTKYHPNGNIQMTGKFQEGEAIKCDYYDDNGNLIFSDNHD